MLQYDSRALARVRWLWPAVSFGVHKPRGALPEQVACEALVGVDAHAIEAVPRLGEPRSSATTFFLCDADPLCIVFTLKPSVD